MGKSWKIWAGILAPMLAFGCLTVASQPVPGHSQPAVVSSITPFDDFSSEGSLPNLPTDQKTYFKLRKDYPISLSKPMSDDLASAAQWRKMPFPAQSTEAEKIAYMNVVLKYCFEGFFENLPAEAAFRPEAHSLNDKRPWFHAPAMNLHRSEFEMGRDPLHGTTFEREALPKELAEGQRFHALSFAIGFYNAQAACTIAKFWGPTLQNASTPPNVEEVQFAEGSVAFKLLFTTATSDKQQVPWLKDAPVWHVYGYNPDMQKRMVMPVRLIQVDILVKDPRAPQQPGIKGDGWVFGTFQYDSTYLPDQPNLSPWLRLRPVALQWGFNPENAKDLTGSWVNDQAPIVQYRKHTGRTMGIFGRANGPVDNQESSCMNCHVDARRRRKTKEDTRVEVRLDYSLQLDYGLQVYESGRFTQPNPTAQNLK